MNVFEQFSATPALLTGFVARNVWSRTAEARAGISASDRAVSLLQELGWQTPALHDGLSWDGAERELLRPTGMSCFAGRTGVGAEVPGAVDAAKLGDAAGTGDEVKGRDA